MSVKGKALAAAASLTLVGGTAGAGALTVGVANAATPSCSNTCVDIYSDQFGNGLTGHPGFLLDSYKQGVATGTQIILFRESNSDPALDFVIENRGTVADFFALGLVSPAIALHYGCVHNTVTGLTCPYSPAATGNGRSLDANLNAYEIEYAPFGAASGECVGVAATPTTGEHVTLQPCGVSAKTVWIVDEFDGANGQVPVFGSGQSFGNGSSGGYSANGNAPLINGADNMFSHPDVLTYPGNGYPTDKPRPPIYVAPLTGFFNGIFPFNTQVTENVSSDQLWDAFNGPVQS
jgi:hypothetical protein